MTDEEIKATMATFQKDMMEKQAAAKKAAGEKNEAEGKKFLEENKTKEGVKTTASGLQYKVLKEGSWPDAERERHRQSQLSRDDDRRQGVRQFLQARKTGLVSQ